jgi:hypothetical protein
LRLVDLLARLTCSILRGLTALPLVCGGVTLIGQPTASAEPVTRELLLNYNAWLWSKRRVLCASIDPEANFFGSGGFDMWRDPPGDNRAGAYHAVDKIRRLLPDKGPLDRAAIVLSAVGSDWRSA